MIERAPVVVEGTVGSTAALEANGPFTASYLTNQDKISGKMTGIFSDYTAWTYCKVGKGQHNDRKVYLALYNNFLVLNNVDHMESAAENMIQNSAYHGEQKNDTFERYVTIQKEQHTILEHLEDHDYKGINERLKVLYLIAGIKSGTLNSVKSTILASAPYHRDHYASVSP